MNRLKELRKAKHLSQEELGSVLGVQKAAVCKYETGRVALPNEMLMKLCDFFDVSADYILCRESAMVTPLFKSRTTISPRLMKIEDSVGVPLVGRVHAGLPILADENIEEYIPVAANETVAGEYFYMQVEGDCMDNVYPEGCYILIDPEQRPSNGSIAVVSIDGADYVMRRLYRGANTLILSPDSHNAEHEDMVFAATTEHTVEFHGTVVWFQSSKEME